MNKLLYTLLALVSVSTLSYAQKLDRSVRPTPGPTPEVKMKDAITYTTDNGIKVFIVEDHKIPKINLMIQFDFDQPLEKDKAGLNQFVGDMAMSGTKSMTKDDINKKIDGYGANVYFGSNSIYAASLTRHFEDVLGITTDILMNSKPSEDELKLLKEQSIAELETLKDSPDGLVATAKSRALYGDKNPYGEVPTEESYNNINVSDCKEYIKKYFRPNNAYLAIVGDVTPDQAKKWVEQYFGNWKKEKVPTHKYELKSSPTDRQVIFSPKTGAVQSNFEICYPVDLKQNNPDVLKVKVANYMLGGGSNSKLFKNLREDHGWTYGAYSSLYPDKLIAEFSASAKTRNEVTDSAVQEAINEMKNMASGDFTDEDLRAAANYLKGSFSRSLESPRNIATYAINLDLYDLDDDYYKNYLKNIDAITKQDIIQTSNKYFHPDQAYIVVSGNKSDVLESLKKFDSDGKIEQVDYLGREMTASAEVPSDKTGIQVVNDYIDATGGRQVWNNVKDIYISAEGEVQGMKLSFEEWRKPGKKREEVSMMGNSISLNVVNGNKVWEVSQGMERELEGDEAQTEINEADFQLELKYDQMGYKTHLDGIEKVDGKDAYVVTVTNPQGDHHVDYFDVNSHYKVRSVQTMEANGQAISQTIDFKDYKEVSGGLILPFTQVLSIGPQKVDVKVTNVKINEGIDDSVFAKN